MHKNKLLSNVFCQCSVNQNDSGENSFQAVEGFTKIIFYAVHSQVRGCEAGKVADGSNNYCAAHNG